LNLHESHQEKRRLLLNLSCVNLGLAGGLGGQEEEDWGEEGGWAATTEEV